MAGRLCGIGRVSDSVVHGVVSWGVGTLAVTFVLTSAALGAIGAAAKVVGGTAQASGAAGAAGLFAFFMLACNGLAAGFGARMGARLMRPVTPSEHRRHEKTAVS